MGIPGINDFQKLTKKIRASFELPQVKSKAQDVENEYSAPPAPKCICQKEFLPPLNQMFPCQDIREGQSQKTLAYAQALQYWAEKSNLPMPGWPCLLARCMLELRRVMEPYVAFSNDAIVEGATPQESSLGGQTQATIPLKTQPAPRWGACQRAGRCTPTEEAAPAEEPTEEAAPTEEPTEEAAPTEVSSEEADPTEVTTEEEAPAEEPAEEPAALTATISDPAEEPDIPPVWHEEKGKGEVPCSDFPGWMEVLHPTWSVTSAGQTPLTLGEFRQRCCSQSVGGRRAPIEEQKNADKPHRKSQTLHHHQGLPNPCHRFHCPQTSRELWPGCWGIHPH